jgi:hypothetical protein
VELGLLNSGSNTDCGLEVSIPRCVDPII